MSRKTLVVEDDCDISNLLKIHLNDINCQVTVVYDGSMGYQKARSTDFDMIILDIVLPGMDGLEICRQLRMDGNKSLIIMLTSKSSEIDRVLGLEIGADDYLSKPFSFRELQARIKAHFRRKELDTLPNDSRQRHHIEYDNLVIDLAKRKVRLNNNNIQLTVKEYDLLVQFAKNPGRVYSRAQLLDLVWGYNFRGYEHTVNSHINRLRAKIEKDTHKPHFIQTVFGVGYRFIDHV